MAAHYAPWELHSFMHACGLARERMDRISNPSIVVPLRGSFLPTFFSGIGKNQPSPKSLHFMPETGYLYKTKEMSHLYLVKYFEGHRRYFEKRKGGKNGPTDEHGFINVVIIDEAKSGNAISSRIHRYATNVIETLKQRETNSLEEKVAAAPGEKKQAIIEGEIRNYKEIANEAYRAEREKLRHIVSLAREGGLKIITERGDFTPEAAFLLSMLRKSGAVKEKEITPLTLHRWMVEAKVSLLVRSGRDHIEHVLRNVEEFQKVIGARIDRKFDGLAGLVRNFPGLKGYEADDYTQVSNADLIKLEPHNDPKAYHSAYYSKYVQAFATLANYRLQEVMKLLRKSGGKNLPEIVEAITSLHHKKHGELKNEIRELLSKNNGGLLQGDAPALSELLGKSNVFNRFRLHVISIHGIDYPSYIGRYFALKDAGAIEEISTNRIITMDNPLSSIHYERIGSTATHKFKFSPTPQMKELLTDSAPYFPGENLPRRLTRYCSRLTHHTRYIRKAVEAYVRQLRASQAAK